MAVNTHYNDDDSDNVSDVNDRDVSDTTDSDENLSTFWAPAAAR